MSLANFISGLYVAGVDCGLETYRGSGVTVWIVYPGNHRVSRDFRLDEFDEIEEWLLSEAAVIVNSRLEQHESHQAILEALSKSKRRDPKRVSAEERLARHRSAAAPADGTHD